MEDKITELIRSVLSDKSRELTGETSFKEDLNMKSMDFYYILSLIEEEYDLEFEDREVQKVKTIGEIMVLCREKILGKSM